MINKLYLSAMLNTEIDIKPSSHRRVQKELLLTLLAKIHIHL